MISPTTPHVCALPRSAATPLERCASACGERAWRMAYALLRHADDAYDAVQQAFLVAARKPERVPADDPWPWLSAVLLHEVRNLRRKRRPLPLGEALQGGGMAGVQAPDAHERAERREERERLWSGIQALPETEREALVLTHVSGLTHADAAAALGVARQTLTDRVRRGLDALARSAPRERGALSRALLLLPLAEPPGGLAQAIASWTQTALASAGAVAGGAGTAAATGGALMGATSKVWLAGLALAAGVSFVGGGATGALGLFDGSERAAAPPREAAAPLLAGRADAVAAAEPAAPALAASDGAQAAQVERLRAENERLARRAETAERALAQAGPGNAPRRGATFTFGEAGRLAAVRDADWGELAGASTVVNDAVVELLRHAEAGTEAPKELYLALQENVERMRRYEYRTIDRLPTAAQHNGEFTHPITLANLAAATAEQGGQPLTAAQVAEIARLGTAFDADFARLRESWSPAMARVRRMLGEYRLKGAFTSAFFAALTAEQRALLVEPEFRGLAGLDLNDPTLMILHTTPVVTGASAAEVRTKLGGMLRKKLTLPEAPVPALETHMDAFLERTGALLAVPVAKARARHYAYEQGLVAGEATVALVEGLMGEPEVPAAARDLLREDPTWYLPRLILP